MAHFFRHALGRAQRPTAVVFLAVAALWAIAPAASAHVTVSTPDAAPGGYGKLVFRVPTESATASTVKLTVTLPDVTPFANVSAKSMPGWSLATTEKKLAKPITDDDGFNLTKAVSTVTWTAAEGQGVAPGEFNEFELSVGPFPKGTAAMTLPVVQTYSDGTVVKWDQPTPASGKEPEHPAPTLEMAAAETPPTPSAKDPASSVGQTSASGGGGDSDGLARWLGGAGLALGVAALVIALRSNRRRTA
jgi:periplasmic copper chaperone A